MINILNHLLAKIVIILIKIYQFTLSPDKGLPSFWLKGKICIHTPHCSEYGIQVLKRYGFIPGTIKMIERISQCHPWNNNNYDPAYYKIVFMSNSFIGVPFLNYFKNDSRFEIVGVVTSCDKPKDRGLNLCENIIKTTANNIGINNIITPNIINPNKGNEGIEFINWLKKCEPDFIVVISYGKILPKEVLQVPKIASLNAHGSILPKYRGASPIQSVLLDGETKTGLTTMLITEGMDEGDIIKIMKFDLPYNRTSKNILDKFCESGPQFFVDSVYEFGKGLIKNIKQNNDEATYCKKITKLDGKINVFQDNVKIIYNKYKAYFMWPKIWFEANELFGKCDGKIIKIEKIEINEKNYSILNGPIFDENLNLNPLIDDIYFKIEGKKTISRNEFKKGYIKC